MGSRELPEAAPSPKRVPPFEVRRWGKQRFRRQLFALTEARGVRYANPESKGSDFRAGARPRDSPATCAPRTSFARGTGTKAARPTGLRSRAPPRRNLTKSRACSTRLLRSHPGTVVALTGDSHLRLAANGNGRLGVNAPGTSVPTPAGRRTAAAGGDCRQGSVTGHGRLR